MLCILSVLTAINRSSAISLSFLIFIHDFKASNYLESYYFVSHASVLLNYMTKFSVFILSESEIDGNFLNMRK